MLFGENSFNPLKIRFFACKIYIYFIGQQTLHAGQLLNQAYKLCSLEKIVLIYYTIYFLLKSISSRFVYNLHSSYTLLSTRLCKLCNYQVYELCCLEKIVLIHYRFVYFRVKFTYTLLGTILCRLCNYQVYELCCLEKIILIHYRSVYFRVKFTYTLLGTRLNTLVNYQVY